MSNEAKKFAGLEALQVFLDGCKTLFASITHKHTLSDISDYTVDTELSSTSTNPVQNKVINEEFEAVSTAMGALESAIDDKLDTATASSTYETKEDAQIKYDTITNTKADWNQNDENAIDYVKNRTHWAEQATEVIVAETSEDYIEILVGAIVEEGVAPDPLYEINVNYIVKLDGKKYECTSYTNSVGCFALGDSRLFTIPWSGEIDNSHPEDVPFFIYAESDDGGGFWGADCYEYWYVLYPDSNAHTIQIEKVLGGTTYHPLDENFIPDSIARTEDIAATYALKSDLENIDLSGYETIENAQSKLDEAKEYTDNAVATKADTTHNHDTSYDTKGAADTALATAKEYTDNKTANMVTSTIVDNKISTHNTATDAHNDIRDLIDGLSTRLNALADSDDETLDQMSEIVEYIKANKALIDSVTTGKVSVTDIVDNLTTNVSNKPLSAAQGVVIKALIDALQAELDSHGHAITDVTGLQSALDGKSGTGHTHTVVNGVTPEWSGSVAYGDTGWLAAWTSDGSKIKALDKNNFATNSALNTLSDVVAGKAASGHGHSAATTSAAGFLSASDKSKLDGITASADSVSFSRSLTSGTKIGTITINGTGTDLYCQTNTDTNTHYTTRIYAGASGTAANASATSPYIKITDDNTYRNQIRLVGGGATTVTSDGSGNITISSTDSNTTYSTATTSAAGLMSAAMVTKLNGIATGANAYSLPTATSSTLGGVKIGSNITVSSGTISLSKSNVTSALGYTPPTTNTTYSVATSTSSGLMSASDKAKLDDIAEAYVQAQGTSGGWGYRNWSNGFTELWRITTAVPCSVSSAWGSVYVQDNAIASSAYPVTFTSYPYVVASVFSQYDGSVSGDYFLFTGTNGSTTASPHFGVMRPKAPSANINLSAQLYVCGYRA